jgi:hypothetical protein
MTSLIQDMARHYRMRAEETRARAEVADTEETRKSLLQLANTWERMAQYEESNNPQSRFWKKGPST